MPRLASACAFTSPHSTVPGRLLSILKLSQDKELLTNLIADTLARRAIAGPRVAVT
jgi:hypothetical protein